MILAAVKKGDHEMVKTILSGSAPKNEGFDDFEGTVHDFDDFGDPLLVREKGKLPGWSLACVLRGLSDFRFPGAHFL